MTAFDESRHARDRSGKFAAHVGTEQQGALSEQEPDREQATEEFPEWERPLVARPEHYAELWADDLEVSRDSAEWQAQYAQNLEGLRDVAAAHVAGLYGLPTGAGDTAQVTATGARKSGVEFVHYDCGNGFGLAMCRGGISYGHEDGLWEASLARTGPRSVLEPPEPGTARDLLGWHDDVCGYLSPEDVGTLLAEVTAVRPEPVQGKGAG